MEKLEENEFDEIEFDKDNYWYVSSDEREVFSEKLPSLIVGSIADDIQSLKKVLDKTNIPTPVDFDRLGNVLIALGERISRSDKIF
ncbi:hypothetical protein ABCY62_02205 [Acetivibrio clariflavus]|uniref:hypothetical protein n=2 Tax=Acetivibrio clariflavus TaxID=288965 RepID=UPI0031F4933A